MWARRFFYRALFPAALVLPLWLLIGRGLIVDGPGWEFVLLLFVCPVLAVLMAITGGLIFARRSVRDAKAVSWPDVALLTGWYAAIIAGGFFAHTAVAVLVVLTTVAAFWFALWSWFVETRNRVRGAFASLEYTATSAGFRSTQPGTASNGANQDDARPAVGRVIRIEPRE